MEKDKDVLERAAEVLKNEEIPPGPPQELVEATIAKLAEASEQPDTIQIEGRIRIRERLKAINNLNKVAAAAILLIVAGYTVGRLSAPRSPDIKELQEALEPAIRQDLFNEMNQRLQVSYVHLRDEFDRQYRQDMTRVAMQVLATSNMVTNERLAELIESINEAQTYERQERQRLTAALEQVESNRRHDSTQLGNALATFAVQTEDELLRTKRDVAQALLYALPDNSAPGQFRDVSDQE
jgi:hypothetical protein